MKFNWKKKTAIYIGRFQPFHIGHKKLFLKALKSSKQVCILIMDSQGINKKNPYSFKFVKKKITQELKDYKNKFIIIKIPVVSAVVYGRKVGYKIRKINLPMNIEKISATMIRKKTNLK
jgi:adenylylsulfate kinase